MTQHNNTRMRLPTNTKQRAATHLPNTRLPQPTLLHAGGIDHTEYPPLHFQGTVATKCDCCVPLPPRTPYGPPRTAVASCCCTAAGSRCLYCASAASSGTASTYCTVAHSAITVLCRHSQACWPDSLSVRHRRPSRLLLLHTSAANHGRSARAEQHLQHRAGTYKHKDQHTA
jgi:hypothetical protein